VGIVQGRPAGSRHSPDSRPQLGAPTKPLKAQPFPAWCKANIVQSVDKWAGKPLKLEPWQRTFMGQAMERTGKRFKWESIALVLPRKNGKTALLSAYALYRLLTDSGQPEILLAAASDRQAGRLFEAVENYILRNEQLLDALIIRRWAGEISRKDGRGKILRMASEPSTLHGYNPSLVICDELGFWTKPSQRKGWAALTSGGGARDLKQTFSISTAGEANERADSILGGLIDRNEADGEVTKTEGLTISANEESRTLIWNYCAPTLDPHDAPKMKLANPASWITEEWLARQASNPELSEGEVLQLHGCVWSTAKGSWMRPGLWEACMASYDVPPDVEITVGFDGSYNDDSTAIIGCTIADEPYVFVIGLWERPAHSKSEWVVPREEVMAKMDETMTRYKVRELAADPPGWHKEIGEWEDRYGDVVVTEFRTQMRKFMARACARLHSAVVNETMTHDGNPRLAVHVANAVTKETPDGAYITKEYRNSPRKIDAATATVIAYDRAVTLYEQGQSVYAERGLLIVTG
jgi:phage terminase large subunit-like protein